MNKVVEFTGREGQLLEEAIKRLRVETSHISVTSENQRVVSITRGVLRELDILADKVKYADLA